MAGDPDVTVVLSVRGHAEQLVQPDDVTLSCRIAVAGDTKAQALQGAAVATDAVIADLVEAGGSALHAAAPQQPLLWSRRSVVTEPERHPDSYEPTGRTSAVVSVLVVARELDGLDALMILFSRHQRLDVQDVAWGVDSDNPAWKGVRAEAVAAALQRGRDYAAALGGRVVSVEQVADVGLLSAGAPEVRRGSSMQLMSASHGEPETPSLDPVPQTLSTAVEARLIARTPALPTADQ